MNTVLVIDDDTVFRTILTRLLKEVGWNVIEAQDGELGIQYAFEHKPDVVLCDLLMPRCNGFQVCRTIKARRELLPKTKIIVTTGSSYATDRVNALEAGADEYVVKPIKPTALFQLLEKVMSGQTEDKAPEEPAAAPVSDRSDTVVRFWGVRGSVPTPGPSTVFYGGNTSCVEVRAMGKIIILDAGTGIRPLGLQLSSEFKNQPIEPYLLISHTHWDHIQGFPFFVPAYDPKNRIRILSCEGARRGLESILSSQMESPYFPISMQAMPSNIVVTELRDMRFHLDDLEVQACFMNHPGVCVGYRLETPAGSVAYLPDNELFQRMKAQPGTSDTADIAYAQHQDQKIIDFIRDAEVVIMDSQYDAQEYQKHIGWGHSCVDDAVGVCLEAKVRRLFLFHHDPSHDDNRISQMVAHARQLVVNAGSELLVEAAREGLELALQPKEQLAEATG